ncbi:MAG TPA: hypothetical protein VK815_01010 [Candidatus Acidoferrales bacterium]|jgi:hypothetical protein|nr:hypothetical protein [Candidatus Acidoferrales bacterium]
MDFLKKHYEKILLGLVLAGLIGALVFMPFYISSDNADMTALTEGIIKRTPTELTNLDLTVETTVTARLHGPYSLDLETGNRAFNPMEWVKDSQGGMMLAGHNGPQLVVVTNITPLYLNITLDTVTTNGNDIPTRYAVGVEKQAEKSPPKRHKVPRFISKGDKPNDTFGLVDVKSTPDNPDADELTIKLVDTGELVTISKQKSYKRVDAYAADFRYPPENKTFLHRREGDHVSFNGTDFIVDGVSQNEVILQDQSNQKKTARPFNP